MMSAVILQTLPRRLAHTVFMMQDRLQDGCLRFLGRIMGTFRVAFGMITVLTAVTAGLALFMKPPGTTLSPATLCPAAESEHAPGDDLLNHFFGHGLFPFPRTILDLSKGFFRPEMHVGVVVFFDGQNLVVDL